MVKCHAMVGTKTNVITTAILVPLLVYAWEPVKAQLGR